MPSLRSFGLQTKILLAFTLVNLISIAAFISYAQYVKAQDIREQMDNRLRAAAHAVPRLLGTDYLERSRSTDGLHEGEYMAQMRNLGQYVQEVELKFAYILQVDASGRAFYLADAASEHELDKNFNDAKEIEKQQVVQRAANEQLHGSLFGVLGAFWGSPSAKKPLRKKSRFGYEFDPQNTVIKLDSPREAEEIIKGIDKGVQDIFSEQEQRLTEASGRFIEDFQKKFDEDISKKANEVIGELNKRLKGEGFAIHLKVPHMPHLSMRGDNMNSLHNLIEDKRRWETRKRHKKGVWGTVCSWFNTDDWGTEEYQARVGSIEIDTVKIRKAIAEKVDRIFKDLDSTVQETIKKSLEEQVGDFFDEIKQTVNALRADLNQSILDKQKSQESQKTLATLLRKLKRQAPAIQQDSEALHQDVQTLLGEAA